METPFSKAWRAWLKTPEGGVSSELKTLVNSGPSRNNTYLENRLHAAFAAGWNALRTEWDEEKAALARSGVISGEDALRFDEAMERNSKGSSEHKTDG